MNCVICKFIFTLFISNVSTILSFALTFNVRFKIILNIFLYHLRYNILVTNIYSTFLVIRYFIFSIVLKKKKTLKTVMKDSFFTFTSHTTCYEFYSYNFCRINIDICIHSTNILFKIKLQFKHD